jgi:hypothetical protein
MLIEHRPSHFNQGLILALNNIILLRNIRQGKLVLKTQRRIEGIKLRVLKFCAIVTADSSYGIFGQLSL